MSITGSTISTIYLLLPTNCPTAKQWRHHTQWSAQPCQQMAKGGKGDVSMQLELAWGDAEVLQHSTRGHDEATCEGRSQRQRTRGEARGNTQGDTTRGRTRGDTRGNTQGDTTWGCDQVTQGVTRRDDMREGAWQGNAETLTPRYTRKAQADRAPGFADKALSERYRSADKAQ